jgi:hypothetical protein
MDSRSPGIAPGRALAEYDLVRMVDRYVGIYQSVLRVSSGDILTSLPRGTEPVCLRRN